MRKSPRVFRNLWALTVLALLRERPLHPYEMQRLIRQRYKDELLDLRPGSLYHAIERLERAELIRPLEREREGRRPERTVYELTDIGLEELLDWLRELLSRPARDSKQLLAALGNLAILSPEEVAECLRSRSTMLEAEVAALDSVLRTLTPRIGRLVLIETEAARALKWAELEWVQALEEDVRTGVLHWNLEELLQHPDAIPGLPVPAEEVPDP